MAHHASEHYRIFAVKSSRPLLLGECYLIVTAYNSFGPYWFGEQFLLLQLPTSRLERAKFRLRPSTYTADDLSMVNADFVFDGVQGLARAALASILIEQFEATKNWEVLATKFDFDRVSDDVLTNCWVRSLYHAELRDVADNTETIKLPQILDLLRGLPVFELQ